MRKIQTAPSRKKKIASKRPRRRTILSLFSAYRKGLYGSKAHDAQVDALHLLAKAYRNSGLVLYIGAGVSISIGLPSWAELVQALTVRSMSMRFHAVAAAAADTIAEDYFTLHQSFMNTITTRSSADRPVLMLARALKSELKDDLPAAIASTLYRRVGRNFPSSHSLRYQRMKERRSSTGRLKQGINLALLDAIANLARSDRAAKGVQAIVNYNYDDLLEEYLKSQNIKCKAILSGRDLLPEGTLPSYHVHGIIRYKSYQEYMSSMHLTRGGVAARKKTPSAEGSFVFSEDEYHAQYADFYTWSNLTQMNYLGQYTGLFVGLSLEDPNIRRLIDVTHRQYPGAQYFAILCRKSPLRKSSDSSSTVVSNLFEEVETQAFKDMGVTPIWVDDHSQIPDLIDKVVTGTSSS